MAQARQTIPTQVSLQVGSPTPPALEGECRKGGVYQGADLIWALERWEEGWLWGEASELMMWGLGQGLGVCRWVGSSQRFLEGEGEAVAGSPGVA